MLLHLAVASVVAVTGVGAVPVAGHAASQIPTSTAVPLVAAVGRDEGGVEVTQLEVVVPALGEGARLSAPDAVVAATLVADRVESQVVEPGAFQTLGVTWPRDALVDDLDLQVRTRAASGGWSAWVPLEIADEAPDAGTVDAGGSRGGTSSLWVGESDAVQLSFGATPQGGPAGLALTLVDVPEEPAAAVMAPLAAVTGTPTVITREEWGARPQACQPDVATKGLVGAVVHHTAGSNDYTTVEQAERQIRGDQAYHIDGRKWCDIGYNFIVDKWGNIYEGRADSLTKPVIGVHAGGFNTATVGVSMLGNYETAVTPAAMVSAVAQIVGWRLGAYGIHPEGTMTYHTLGGDNSKFPAGTDVRLSRVFGHREVSYTTCPGRHGFAQMSTIRSMAASYGYDQRFIQANAVVKAMYEDILGRGVDPSGLQTWSAMLAGGSGLPALVSSLTSSDEYIRMRIRRAYVETLGREPEPAGADNWYRAIRAGGATVDDVQRKFMSTSEFHTKSGGTDAGYVTRMYPAAFGRPAAPDEVTYWVDLIAQFGREKVTDGLWFSGEAARRRAGVYYQTFLKRAPDPAGQAMWGTVLLRDGEGAVRIGIAGSEEYRQRALVRFP